tara:strand:+ start:1256 stop:1393 length:138 start_codon:yes stop_codon:yes gene_type:complete
MSTISDLNTVWAIISLMFFAGGVTIGWYVKDFKYSKIKRGSGRWD